MDRLDFYFRQLVTEGDMDLAFDQVQDRIETAASREETGFEGMIKGGDVSEAAVPDLTVDVSGDAVGYTPEGKRVAWDALQNVDVSEDEHGVSTEVATVGNSRYISLFVEFTENLDDLRTDGFGLPVYLKRNASFQFVVVMSAEAVTPVLPPLRDDALLLCDITRVYGQTTIQNTDIDLARREDYFRRVGTNDSIVAGRARDVEAELLDLHNQHIDDLANVGSGYGASLVGINAYTGTAPTGGLSLSWSSTDVRSALVDLVDQLSEYAAGDDGASRIGRESYSWLSSENVSDTFKEIVDDLASASATTTSGAYRVGIHTYATTPPTNGFAMSFGSTRVQYAVQAIMNQIAAESSPTGADLMGADAKTGAIISIPSPATLPQGSVEEQLETLIDYFETIRNTPYTAAAISFSPYSYLTSINVQDAIEEMVDDLALTGAGSGSSHIGIEGWTESENTAAPSWTMSDTDLQTALEALADEIAKRAALNGGQSPFVNAVQFGTTDFALSDSGTGPLITLEGSPYKLQWSNTNHEWTWTFNNSARTYWSYDKFTTRMRIGFNGYSSHTASLDAPLHIESINYADPVGIFEMVSSSATEGPAHHFRYSRAANNPPSGQTIGSHKYQYIPNTGVHDRAYYVTSAVFKAVVGSGTPSPTSTPSTFFWQTTPAGSTTPLDTLRLNQDGDLEPQRSSGDQQLGSYAWYWGESHVGEAYVSDDAIYFEGTAVQRWCGLNPAHINWDDYKTGGSFYDATYGRPVWDFDIAACLPIWLPYDEEITGFSLVYLSPTGGTTTVGIGYRSNTVHTTFGDVVTASVGNTGAVVNYSNTSFVHTINPDYTYFFKMIPVGTTAGGYGVYGMRVRIRRTQYANVPYWGS